MQPAGCGPRTPYANARGKAGESGIYEQNAAVRALSAPRVVAHEVQGAGRRRQWRAHSSTARGPRGARRARAPAGARHEAGVGARVADFPRPRRVACEMPIGCSLGTEPHLTPSSSRGGIRPFIEFSFKDLPFLVNVS